MKQITLKTLPQATAQQVFNQGVLHLLTQRAISAVIVDGKIAGSCLYRSKGGLKCVAGCFIADDEYSSRMEGASWAHLNCSPIEHADLIGVLQDVHDGYCQTNANKILASWPLALVKVAHDFGLEVPSVLRQVINNSTFAEDAK